MNRQLLQIRRYLERGPEPGCTPFDRYAYNTFSWQAAYYINHGRSDEERAEATHLRDLACAKSRALRESEVSRD